MNKQNPFKYYKTSPDIIRLAVMYYVRYPLSYRRVEDILHERGIAPQGHLNICYETVRYWVERFGLIFANEIRQKNQVHSPIGNGIWMKCSSKSMVSNIIYGERLTMKVRCLRAM